MFERAFARHLVADGSAEPNFSLQLAEVPKHGRAAGFNFLYRGSTRVLRTRDLKRLVQGLLTHVASYALERDPTRLRLYGLGLVGEAGAILLPGGILCGSGRPPCAHGHRCS